MYFERHSFHVYMADNTIQPLNIIYLLIFFFLIFFLRFVINNQEKVPHKWFKFKDSVLRSTKWHYTGSIQAPFFTLKKVNLGAFCFMASYVVFPRGIYT